MASLPNLRRSFSLPSRRHSSATVRSHSLGSYTRRRPRSVKENHDLYTFSGNPESVDGGVSFPSCKPRNSSIKRAWGWGGEGGIRGTELHQLVSKGEITHRDINAHRYSINARDEYEQTPLMRAVWYDRLKTVQLLIANGAKIAVEDRFHKNVFTIAARRGNWKTFEYLMINHFNKNDITQEVRDEYLLAELNSYVYPSQDRDKIKDIIHRVINIQIRHGDLIKFIKHHHISAIKYVEQLVYHPPKVFGKDTIYDQLDIIKTTNEYNGVMAAYDAAISELPGCKRRSSPSRSIRSVSRGGTRRTHKKKT